MMVVVIIIFQPVRQKNLHEFSSYAIYGHLWNNMIEYQMDKFESRTYKLLYNASDCISR